MEAIDKGELDLDYAINVLIETELFEDVAGATGWAGHFDTRDDGDDVSTTNWESAFKNLDTKQTEVLLIFLAKQAAYQPRMLSAYSLSLGSVNDPIFWGAHNSWERMWHYKRLEGADDTEHESWWSAWNETDILDDSNAATCTWSSAAESTLPFYDLMKDDDTENKYYTNKDMLRMFHPDNKNLPHIYDSLEYTHCSSSYSEEDRDDAEHTEMQVKMISNYRRRQAEKYGAKVERGYTEDEAEKLNKYYEYIFDQKTLDNYGDRPIYEGTYNPDDDATSDASDATQELAKQTDDGLTLDEIMATDWYIYKITGGMRPGKDLDAYDFVNRYLLPDAFGMESVGCNSTHIGGAYKANFTATGSASNNNQIHWVNGPIMKGADVNAEWIDTILTATVGTTESREGMGLVYDSDTATFTAYMHNKVQFYVPDLSLFAKALDADSVAHLKRKSTVAFSDTDSTKVELGHLSVPVEGKTYEIVGPLVTLADTSSYDDYVEWSDYECPTCQSLAEDFTTLNTRYEGTANTTTWYNWDTGEVDGRDEPMLVSVHVAVSYKQSLDDMGVIFQHLHDYTHAKWELSSTDSGSCKTASLSWDSMPGVVIKYVQNNHDDLPDRYGLAKYEEVWSEQYEKTFFDETELPSSAHWHHFLDTHIGLTGTQGDGGGYCDEAFAALTKGLQSSYTGFATRDESDEMHLYVGYKGTTAWEYNLATGCSTDVSFGDICGCVAENSVNVYNRIYDKDVDECPKMCALVDDDGCSES